MRTTNYNFMRRAIESYVLNKKTLAKWSKSCLGDGRATGFMVVAISFVANTKMDAMSSPFFKEKLATTRRRAVHRQERVWHGDNNLLARVLAMPGDQSVTNCLVANMSDMATTISSPAFSPSLATNQRPIASSPTWRPPSYIPFVAYC